MHLRSESISPSGFGGVSERRLVVDPRLMGHRPGRTNWSGLGQFVYLADAVFAPGGSSGYHEHFGVDVVTVVIEGELEHHGSVGRTRRLAAPAVQVQRAGAIGFGHDEINPGERECRVLQTMFLPSGATGAPSCRTQRLHRGRRTIVYRSEERTEGGILRTVAEVALLAPEQRIEVRDECLMYVVSGMLATGCGGLARGDLFRAPGVESCALSEVFMLIVRVERE